MTKIAHERVTEGNLEEKRGRSGKLGRRALGEQRDLNGFVVPPGLGVKRPLDTVCQFPAARKAGKRLARVLPGGR